VRQVEERLIITGHLADAGLNIRGIHRNLDDWPSPPPGRYRAELLDAEGRTISHAYLGLRPPLTSDQGRTPNDPIGWDRFRVSLPYSPDADLLIIREGARVRASLPVPINSIQTPKARVVVSDEEEQWLEWKSNGPIARIHIAYSPFGEAPWQTLHIDTKSGKFRLPMGRLASGLYPTLRITAQTGLRFADDFVPLRR